MKSKWKKVLASTLLLSVLLTGCAVAKGLYADEIPEEDIGIEEYVPMEIVPAEEYHEWVEEKVDSGELVDLSVGENHAYGTPGMEVITDQDTIDLIDQALRDAGLLE